MVRMQTIPGLIGGRIESKYYGTLAAGDQVVKLVKEPASCLKTLQ